MRKLISLLTLLLISSHFFSQAIPDNSKKIDSLLKMALVKF
jgi:hypothetical protein